jgi:eukaryotic-like serine/threonine-protein kinase
MAEVFLVRRTGLGAFERLLALKRVLPSLENDERYVTMFLDEARLAARLRHPNIGQIFEVDRDARGLYYVMEYVEGPSVAELFRAFAKRRTAVPVGVVAFVIERAARGLHHAHELKTDDGRDVGLVHRDVSPSNVLVGINGEVKVVDFGIARAIDREVETQSGQLKGKYSYMSPEQCRSGNLDRRSDVFSLGVVFHELLTMQRLFRQGERPLYLLLDEIVNGRIPPPSSISSTIDPALDAIVGRATASSRDERYATCELMADAIRDWIRTSSVAADAVELSMTVRAVYTSPVVPKAGSLETRKLALGFDATHEQTTRQLAPVEDSVVIQIEPDDTSSLTSNPTKLSPPLAPPTTTGVRRRRRVALVGAIIAVAVGAAVWIAMSTPTLAGAPARGPAPTVAPPLSTQPAIAAPLVDAAPEPTADKLSGSDAVAAVPTAGSAITPPRGSDSAAPPGRKKSRAKKPGPGSSASADPPPPVSPVPDDKEVLFRDYDHAGSGSAER